MSLSLIDLLHFHSQLIDIGIDITLCESFFHMERLLILYAIELLLLFLDLDAVQSFLWRCQSAAIRIVDTDYLRTEKRAVTIRFPLGDPVALTIDDESLLGTVTFLNLR